VNPEDLPGVKVLALLRKEVSKLHRKVRLDTHFLEGFHLHKGSDLRDSLLDTLAWIRKIRTEGKSPKSKV
jgi:hypothetical protein